MHSGRGLAYLGGSDRIAALDLSTRALRVDSTSKCTAENVIGLKNVPGHCPIRFAFGSVLLAIASVAMADGCGPVSFIPLSQTRLSDPQPLISWQSVPEATRYRLDIVARVPEGRVLENIRTVTTAPSFRLPRRIEAPFALISVSVTPVCPDAGEADPGDSRIEFLTDTRKACPADDGIAVSQEGSAISLAWQGSMPSEIARYRASDGALVSRSELQAPRYRIPTTNADLEVAVLRFPCTAGGSEARFVIY